MKKGTKHETTAVVNAPKKMGRKNGTSGVQGRTAVQLSSQRVRNTARNDHRDRTTRSSTQSRPTTQEVVQEAHTSAIKTYDIVFNKRELVGMSIASLIIVFALGVLIGVQI